MQFLTNPIFGISISKDATRETLSALALKKIDGVVAYMTDKGTTPRKQRDNEPTLDYAKYLHDKLTHRHPNRESYVEIAPAKHHMTYIAKIEKLLEEGKEADDVEPLLKHFRKEDMGNYPGRVKKALNRILRRLGREPWPYRKPKRRPKPKRE